MRKLIGRHIVRSGAGEQRDKSQFVFGNRIAKDDGFCTLKVCLVRQRREP
jgi:hypothetical protein